MYFLKSCQYSLSSLQQANRKVGHLEGKRVYKHVRFRPLIFPVETHPIRSRRLRLRACRLQGACHLEGVYCSISLGGWMIYLIHHPSNECLPHANTRQPLRTMETWCGRAATGEESVGPLFLPRPRAPTFSRNLLLRLSRRSAKCPNRVSLVQTGTAHFSIAS